MIGKKVICLGTIAMTFMLNVYGKGLLRCDDKDVQDKLIHLIMKEHLDRVVGFLDNKKAKQIVKNSLKITYGDGFMRNRKTKDYVDCVADISRDIKYEKVLELVNLRKVLPGEYNEMLEDAQEVHSKLQRTIYCSYEAQRTDDGIHITDVSCVL